MPGLELGVNGGVKWKDYGGGQGFSSSTAPASATEAGFGSGYTQPGVPSGLTNFVTPDDPAGMAFWVGVVSLGLLLFIRHSLPH